MFHVHEEGGLCKITLSNIKTVQPADELIRGKSLLRFLSDRYSIPFEMNGLWILLCKCSLINIHSKSCDISCKSKTITSRLFIHLNL